MLTIQKIRSIEQPVLTLACGAGRGKGKSKKSRNVKPIDNKTTVPPTPEASPYAYATLSLSCCKDLFICSLLSSLLPKNGAKIGRPIKFGKNPGAYNNQ